MDTCRRLIINCIASVGLCWACTYPSVARANEVHTLTPNDFTLTAYVLDAQSTGKSRNMPGFGITASGTHAVVGRTVAVDPSVIPYGTVLYIEGVGLRVAEDTGGAIRGRHIDVLVPNNQIAISFGVKHHARVYIRAIRTDTRKHPPVPAF